MRFLDKDEITNVSGGNWKVNLDLGIIEVELSGTETGGQIYGGAVDYMADFFTWWDPAGYYGSTCSGGGGW